MKMSKKFISIGITSVLLFSGISFAYSNNLLVDVKAQMDFGKKIIFNGKTYDKVNSKNEAIRPLVHEGIIYLPESMIEETAGINIDYSADKDEIYIGEKSSKIYFSENEFYPNAKDVERIKNLYYTENPKELFVNNRMFKTALKIRPEADKRDNYYFNTIDVRGKANVIGGSIYIDKSVALDNVKILFRNSNGEGAKVLEYINVKPGEILDFEIDTQGSDIVVMDTNYTLNTTEKYANTYYYRLDNLSFFDLYYK